VLGFGDFASENEVFIDFSPLGSNDNQFLAFLKKKESFLKFFDFF
jgi:hypothetical protein